MSKQKSSSQQYELIPIKVLHDLKAEISQLRKEVTNQNPFQKILVNHMNLDVQLQRKLSETLDKMHVINQRLDRLSALYETSSKDDLITSQNLRHEERHQELLDKFNSLHSKVDNFVNVSKRASPPLTEDLIKKRTHVVYRRTKNL